MLTFVTFLLLCYSAVLCNTHGVFWTIADKRVAIGHDVNLYCNESSLAAIHCCPKHSTRRWFGGPNRELLYKNGISSYPSKYTSRLEDGGFYLTIHNVEVKDLNVAYACSVAIYEYTNILRPHYDIVQVVPETSTKLSMSTEPSISDSKTIGLKKANTEIPYVAIILATFLMLFIVVAIVGCHKRIKKLLMGILKLIEDQTETENSDQESSEEEHLIEVVTATENTDQNNLVESVHSNVASITLQIGTEDINIESGIASPCENDGTSNWFGDGISSLSGDDGISSLSGVDGKLIEDQTKTVNPNKKSF